MCLDIRWDTLNEYLCFLTKEKECGKQNKTKEKECEESYFENPSQNRHQPPFVRCKKSQHFFNSTNKQTTPTK